MRKVIAGFNMTLDGFCDHTTGIPDEEIHDHYTNLLNNSGVVLYGRITYQLMQFWQTLIKNPSGKKSMDDFAKAIDKIPKIVFSNTLKSTDPMAIGWDSAKLSNQTIEEQVLELKKQSGKDILVGSRSIIIQLMNLHLIDEFQLTVYPVVSGGSLPLFENINDRTLFRLKKTKIFRGGAITLYYEPVKSNN